MLGEILLDG